MGLIESIVFAGVVVFALLMVRYAVSTPGFKDEIRYGPLESRMRCRHCGSVGVIRHRRVWRKTTAAAMNGGISVSGTDFSPTEHRVQARCMNCCKSWYV